MTVAGLVCDVVVPGRVRAVFEVAPGDVVAVLGPNGAGKSTLLQAVAGLLGDVGEVRVDDERWCGGGRPPMLVQDRRLGVAFQGQRLFPHLSALENVAFGPRSRGADRATARRSAHTWLERFGVAELARRRPGELSGGQAQRVALARALVTEPALLLLDEPFSGLDVGVAALLRVELAEHLRAFGGVTLLVTHDPVDALTVADRVLVLEAGEVVQYGAPHEVAAAPLTDHVARLVGLNLLRDGAVMTTFRPSAVALSLGAAEGSPRLRWPGTVTAIVPHGDVLRLQVRTDDGPVLLADVTPSAVVDLGLATGRRVWAAVKATAVETYPAPPAVD